MNAPRSERGAIGFAEKVLELLGEGRYTATYKYAVLLALIDLCLESTKTSGGPPDMVTTRQIAEKIIEVYWPHTVPFASSPGSRVLRQNTSGQAEIVTAILRFRSLHAPDPSVPRWESSRSAPAAYERLVRAVEWKLIEMPLPRLQMIGQSVDNFIFDIYWDQRVKRRDVERADHFDNRVLFKSNVGEYLIQLSGLLRPLIQRHWASMVAQLNRLQDAQLEEFLFGINRTQTVKIRGGLWEIQGRRCFYCDERLAEPTTAEVDHFVPWSRYPDNGLDNLVVVDARCNGFKSSSLAAADHVLHWRRRFTDGTAQRNELDLLAERTGWPRQPERSDSVARGIYLRLPLDAKLWLRRREFVPPDLNALSAALGVPCPSNDSESNRPS